ncbi:MAG: hypothetical protein WA183_03100 [Chthoniobacterales bacterium]
MPIKPRLTLAELQATDCYTELTPRQKVLVDTFVTSGGDRLLATQTAYKTASGEVARVMAYRAFATPRVIAALAAYFQSEPLEDFKAEVRRAYRSRKLTIAQVRAMELHADMNGWASASLPSVHGRDTRLPEPDQETPKTSKPRRVDAGVTDAPALKVADLGRFTVGESVWQEDEEYHVHQVTADGQLVSVIGPDGQVTIVLPKSTE